MPEPIFLAGKLPALDALLLDLLGSLTPDEWAAPTVAKQWRVKDVAAHLLDGNLRVLSSLRDGYAGDPPANVASYEDLVAYLNRLNADWVTAMKRVSPELLLLLLRTTGPLYSAYYAGLDPFGEAPWPVAWAGEETSRNWMHIAREYTEKWLHQQQIRDAVGKPGLLTKEWFGPFLDVFLRALPHAYRDVAAPEGTVVQLHISTEIGGDSFLQKEASGWAFVPGSAAPSAVIRIDPASAWKLFSKSLRPIDLRDKIIVEGDEFLAAPALGMVAVMA
ncbi:MAG: maleylpyruvate isomerase family mycothiol-dependent enzyme [Chitinophagaceae bacterium]|nr:MAG: maleylpyruvate isomerase family mycothiol-dependent enzyme [Chitinophagaceae bacterium]